MYMYCKNGLYSVSIWLDIHCRTGNDLDENKDDMQFISDHPAKKDEDSDMNQSDEPKDGAPDGQVTTVRKPASASLLNSYRQNWKATHNHYLRHSDVRPKDERRPTIMDLANQYRVQEKVNGWKIHHLSTQMEDLVCVFLLTFIYFNFCFIVGWSRT